MNLRSSFNSPHTKLTCKFPARKKKDRTFTAVKLVQTSHNLFQKVLHYFQSPFFFHLKPF